MCHRTSRRRVHCAVTLRLRSKEPQGCRPGSLVTRAAKPTTETSTDQNFFQKIQVRLRPRRFHEAAKRGHDQVHGDSVTATVVAHGAARPQVLAEAARFQA